MKNGFAKLIFLSFSLASNIRTFLNLHSAAIYTRVMFYVHEILYLQYSTFYSIALLLLSRATFFFKSSHKFRLISAKYSEGRGGRELQCCNTNAKVSPI